MSSVWLVHAVERCPSGSAVKAWKAQTRRVWIGPSNLLLTVSVFILKREHNFWTNQFGSQNRYIIVKIDSVADILRGSSRKSINIPIFSLQIYFKSTWIKS